MRKVQLTAYDFGMFDYDISPTEYDFFLKHKGAFKRMWSDQGKKFWNRFVVCFRAFSQNYGAIKEFPVKSDKYEAYIDQAFIYIHDQFVEGKVSTAKGLVLDTVVVAQNRQSLQYLESQSFAKDPFYNKDTRDVFRRLFGQPGEKSSYVKVYFLIPLYVKFGGSVCRCLRHWLDADEIDSSDESYYIPPGPNVTMPKIPKSEARKELVQASSIRETRTRSVDRDVKGSSQIKLLPDSDAQKTTVGESSSDQPTGGTKKKKKKKKAKQEESKRSESSDSTSSGANESKAAKSEGDPMLGAVIAPNSESDPTLDAIIAAVLKNNVEVERMQREAAAAKQAAATQPETSSSVENAPQTKSSGSSSPVRPKTNKKDTFIANEDSPLVQKLEETFGLPKPAQSRKGQRDKSPPIKISVSGCEEGKKKLAEAEERGEHTSATVNVTVTFDRQVRDQITPEKTKAAFEEVLHNMYTKGPKERLSSDPRERKEQIRERLRRKHACKDMPQVLDCHWADEPRRPRPEPDRPREQQEDEVMDISKEDMAKKLSELCKLKRDTNNPWSGPPVPLPAYLLESDHGKSDADTQPSSSTQTTAVQSAQTQTTLSALANTMSDTSSEQAAGSTAQTTVHSSPSETETTLTSTDPKQEGPEEERKDLFVVILNEENPNNPTSSFSSTTTENLQKTREAVTRARDERRGASLVELEPDREEAELKPSQEDEEMIDRRARAVAEQIARLAGIPPQGKPSLDDDALQHINISKYVRESTKENPIMFDGQLLQPGDKIIDVYHPPGTPGIPKASEMAKRIKVLGKPPGQQAGKHDEVKTKSSDVSSRKTSEAGKSPSKKPKDKSTKATKSPSDVQGARAKPEEPGKKFTIEEQVIPTGVAAETMEKIKQGFFDKYLQGRKPVVRDCIEGPGCALIGMYLPQNPDNPDEQDRKGMANVSETMAKIRDMQACQEKWDLTFEEFDEITNDGELQLNDQLVIDYLSRKNSKVQESARKPAAIEEKRPAAIEEKKGRKPGKLRSCSNCGQIEPNPRTFKACQRCKEKHNKYPRFYCGRDCQVEDWGARHRQEHLDMD